MKFITDVHECWQVEQLSEVIDVIKMRPLSDEIAKVYSIYHESPQLILLKNNKVIYQI